MLCDVCGKNPATVHLTEIVDNHMDELHLCEECARQKSAQMEQQFGLSDLLVGLTQFDKHTEDKEGANVKCPSCGLTYKDFRKIGRLGCGECYTSLRKYLAPLLKKIHGSTLHQGKVPVKAGTSRVKKKVDLETLRVRLQKAIQMEAYEEAARLRDQIKDLERKEEGQSNMEKKE